MLKKLGITLTTLLCAGMLVACGNTASKQDKGNESKTQPTVKKAQDVAFMNDVATGNERVWLFLGKDFTKDSMVKNALHVKDGKVEVIDTDLDLKSLDDVEDKDLWGFLVKENQEQFKQTKNEKLQSAKVRLKANEDFLKRFEQYGSEDADVDGIKKDEAQRHLASSQKRVEMIQSTEKIEAITVKPSAKIKTDATGNHVASESIYFEPEKEEALIFNDSYSHGDYTYIPEGHMEILSRQYVGYKGENDTLVTRKTKDIRSLQFDNLKEKGVSELASK
ncbi:hypothetical protein [Enterococcus faecalis]|uniref:hypothetical protein n=1 Tax=Enterococcus faecalis TaxID=1351 RepID=UPI000DEAA5D8|nr:hypothetical protein [Enterococcus faecalis]EGO5063048.1 hypothetical protein [Enterococcus faecalis]EGO7961137.1 hypothetical protein [Enterococcus faecalis]EIM5394324.1 hypothetical protein [Enterococcus faecalis]EIP7717497.1 hypothetical protein [Enterococcus faecalis]EJC3734681.1 hypothetical protein [Enterococcus faecalis]